MAWGAYPISLPAGRLLDDALHELSVSARFRDKICLVYMSREDAPL